MEALYLFLDRNLLIFLLFIFSVDAGNCVKQVLKSKEDESMAKFHKKLDIITAVSYFIIVAYVGLLIAIEIILQYQVKYLLLFFICLLLAIMNVMEAKSDKNMENKEEENKKWSKYWRGDRK